MNAVIFKTVEELKAIDCCEFVKFVKVSGQYRFASMADNHMLSHTELVDPSEYHLVEGAGTIEFHYGKWYTFSDYSSSTLRTKGVKNYITTVTICNEIYALIPNREEPL
jgi:hypothetical protein